MALLKLNDALYTREPVEKEITFVGADGEEHTGTVFVKQHGLTEASRMYKNWQSEDETGLAKAIANSVVDDKGEPLYKASDVERFNQSLIMALLAAIGEVNNPKPTASASKKS